MLPVNRRALHLVGEQEWVEPVLVKSRFEVAPWSSRLGPAGQQMLRRSIRSQSSVSLAASNGRIAVDFGTSRR